MIKINRNFDAKEELAKKLKAESQREEIISKLDALAVEYKYENFDALLAFLVLDGEVEETKPKAAKPAKGKKGKSKPVEVSGSKTNFKKLDKAERDSKLKELFKSGELTSNQIADQTGYSTAAIANFKKAFGLTKKTKATKKKKE
jgi:hypothetical protein